MEKFLYLICFEKKEKRENYTMRRSKQPPLPADDGISNCSKRPTVAMRVMDDSSGVDLQVLETARAANTHPNPQPPKKPKPTEESHAKEKAAAAIAHGRTSRFVRSRDAESARREQHPIYLLLLFLHRRYPAIKARLKFDASTILIDNDYLSEYDREAGLALPLIVGEESESGSYLFDVKLGARETVTPDSLYDFDNDELDYGNHFAVADVGDGVEVTVLLVKSELSPIRAGYSLWAIWGRWRRI
jgi:hypothetical protein